MTYAIRYRPPARKALSKLDKPIARRLLGDIEKLAKDPHPPGCIQLQGGAGELRIRVGDYRIVYDVYDTELVILVLRVGHRREIYR